MKPISYRFKKWFLTRPALRFGLAVAGVLLGSFVPGLFWPGTALLGAGACLHLWAKGCLRQNEVLTVCGPYRRVRHPFYLSYLIIDAGLCLMIANFWVFIAYFAVWFVVYFFQTRFEEQKLRELFGEEYIQYSNRVPALLPYGPHAPSKAGQSFSWSNPNLTRRSEIPRLLRLADFPLLFYLAYRIREAGLEYFSAAGPCDTFWLSALLAVFFFSKLLTPAIRRHRRMLPAFIESGAALFILSVALCLAAALAAQSAPAGRWTLWASLLLAGLAVLATISTSLMRAYIPLMLGCIAVSVAWQAYWAAPVGTFYFAACAVDRALFPRKHQSS